MARGINKERMFTLTNYVSLPINRAISKGEYDDETGKFIPANYQHVIVHANIQPFKDSQIFMMTDTERTREWLNIWSYDELRKSEEGSGGNDADTFIYFGKPYKIMSVRAYKMGVLDHYHAKAALDSPTPRGTSLNG